MTDDGEILKDGTLGSDWLKQRAPHRERTGRKKSQRSLRRVGGCMLLKGHEQGKKLVS